MINLIWGSRPPFYGTLKRSHLISRLIRKNIYGRLRCHEGDDEENIKKARNCVRVKNSLRASSPIWASEASLARTRERGAPFLCPSRLRRSLARSRETRFTRPNRRARSQARLRIANQQLCKCGTLFVSFPCRHCTITT